MNDRTAYAAQMAALGVAFNREVTQPMLKLYWSQLEDVTDAQFKAAAESVVKREKFFPTVAVLRELATPYRDARADAVTAFEAIIPLGSHGPEGTHWSLAKVADTVGPLAAEAFVAAGASRAFGTELGERNLPFLRNRFVDAYVAAADAQARGRELALPESRRRLPKGSPVTALVEQTAGVLSIDRKLKQLPAGEG